MGNAEYMGMRKCFGRILEEKNVKVNLANGRGKTALHYAARYRDEMCDALLKKDANVNAKNENGETPLTVAVLNDSAECVKILSETAADLRGAILYAKTKGDLEAIEILKWSQKMHSLKIRKCTQGKAKLWSVKM